MSRTNEFLQFEHLQCLQIGSGNKILLAFHGFGQNPQVFEVLEKILPHYTIFSFDLLSFGRESSRQEALRLIEKFCTQHNIHQFDLLAFSIGAKIALCIAENFHKRIEKIILIAPDGFKIHFWYKFATSFWGKPLFWKFLQKPKWLYGIINLLNKTSLISKVKVQQIKSYTDSSPKRLLLWKTWLSQKNFSPRLKILTHIFSQKSMKMQIFLAYQDELCPEKPIKQFASKHTNVTLIEMPYKHHRILQEVLKDYRFAQFLG